MITDNKNLPKIGDKLTIEIEILDENCFKKLKEIMCKPEQSVEFQNLIGGKITHMYHTDASPLIHNMVKINHPKLYLFNRK